MQWLRRVLLAASLTIIGVLLFGRLSRHTPDQPAGVAEWPPLGTRTPAPSPTDDRAATTSDGSAAPQPDIDPTSERASTQEATPSVQLLADTPPTLTEAPIILVDRQPSADDTWVLPLDGGACPDGYPVKANDDSGIFHLPGGRFYDRTHAERCYARAEDAEADGFRQAKA